MVATHESVTGQDEIRASITEKWKDKKFDE